jgi:hypothetical protein
MSKILLIISAILFSLNSYAMPDDFCSYPVTIIPESTENEMNQISQVEFSALIKDCFMTAAGASYDSVKDVVQCIGSPIDCAESAVEGIAGIYDALSNISEELRKIWGIISTLSPDQARDMLCTVIGAIAPDIVVAVLTSGAGSGKLGFTISKLTLKIKKMVDVLKNTLLLPVKLVAELSDEVLDSISKVLKSSKKKDFELDLRRTGCVIR